MVKKLPGPEKKVEQNLKKKNLKDWTKWNKKMGGRSCFITSGALGDTLLYSWGAVWCEKCSLCSVQFASCS